MTKEFTTVELRSRGAALLEFWEKDKDKIVMAGMPLYNLLSLKKKLEGELATIEETLFSLAKSFNGEPNESGGLVIPEEFRAAANEAFEEFSKAKIGIEYQPIKITEKDFLPISLYEELFDFIEMKED